METAATWENFRETFLCSFFCCSSVTRHSWSRCVTSLKLYILHLKDEAFVSETSLNAAVPKTWSDAAESLCVFLCFNRSTALFSFGHFFCRFIKSENQLSAFRISVICKFKKCAWRQDGSASDISLLLFHSALTHFPQTDEKENLQIWNKTSAVNVSANRGGIQGWYLYQTRRIRFTLNAY